MIAAAPRRRVAQLTPPELDNPAKFVLRRDVPILTLRKSEGISLARLHDIARNGNRRAARGNFAQILVGHTSDNGPEHKQPPCIGFARNFGVGDFAGGPALLVDFYIKAPYRQLAGDYPHRSAELWSGPKRKHWVIDHISLLKISPRFDLGLITRYAREGDPQRRLRRFSMREAMRPGPALCFTVDQVAALRRFAKKGAPGRGQVTFHWREDEHPREDDGTFTAKEGGGGSTGTPEAAGKVKAPHEMTRAELLANRTPSARSNSLEPWKGEVPPVGTWRMDDMTGELEQLREFDPHELGLTEEGEGVKGREDYRQYVEWAKEGKTPPPIEVVKHADGGLISTNRRRVLAAREAGKGKIHGWFSDTLPSGRPAWNHERMVADAIEKGHDVPADVLADYPQHAGKAKKADGFDRQADAIARGQGVADRFNARREAAKPAPAAPGEIAGPYGEELTRRVQEAAAKVVGSRARGLVDKPASELDRVVASEHAAVKPLAGQASLFGGDVARSPTLAREIEEEATRAAHARIAQRVAEGNHLGALLMDVQHEIKTQAANIAHSRIKELDRGDFVNLMVRADNRGAIERGTARHMLRHAIDGPDAEERARKALAEITPTKHAVGTFKSDGKVPHYAAKDLYRAMHRLANGDQDEPDGRLTLKEPEPEPFTLAPPAPAPAEGGQKLDNWDQWANPKRGRMLFSRAAATFGPEFAHSFQRELRALRRFARNTANRGKGHPCGIGPGGFQEANTCHTLKGGGIQERLKFGPAAGGNSSSATSTRSKPAAAPTPPRDGPALNLAPSARVGFGQGRFGFGGSMPEATKASPVDQLRAATTARQEAPQAPTLRDKADANRARIGSPDARKRIADKLRKAAGLARKGDEATPGSVRTLPVSSIKVDPERFQFKQGGNAKTGATDEMKGVRKWNPELAGTIQVWKDPGDGETYVINGHHRLDLANRLGAGKVNAMYIEAANAKEARAKGALTNIAEGRGTAIDAGKFFRDTGISKEDLEDVGVPMKEAIASQGLGIAKLAQPLFDQVVQGELPIERAAIIGGSGLNEDDQMALHKLVQKKGRFVTNGIIRELIGIVSQSSKRSKGTNLFGDEEEESNAVHRATLQDTIGRRLSGESKLFGLVSKSKHATELARGNNVIDTEASGKIATDADQTLSLFDTLKARSGKVSNMLNDAADRIGRGENAQTVTDATYKQLLKELPEMLANGDFFA